MKILNTNLYDLVAKHPENKGWFFGQFIKNPEIFNSNDLELKWGVHQKGEPMNVVKANNESKSLSILISGKVKILYPDQNESVLLEKQGDSVYWENNVFHSAEILEDSTILTIRWPSIEGDQIFK